MPGSHPARRILIPALDRGGNPFTDKNEPTLCVYKPYINDAMTETPPQANVYLECQCCFNNTCVKNITLCDKGHRVCSQCIKKLQRRDCLFCVPHRMISIIEQPINPTTTPISIIPVRNKYPVCRQLLDFLYFIAKLVLGFFAAVYIGKVYVAIWYGCNPQMDGSWFSWASLSHCIGEAFIGLVVSMVLAGCCVSR